MSDNPDPEDEEEIEEWMEPYVEAADDGVETSDDYFDWQEAQGDEGYLAKILHDYGEEIEQALAFYAKNISLYSSEASTALHSNFNNLLESDAELVINSELKKQLEGLVGLLVQTEYLKEGDVEFEEGVDFRTSYTNALTYLGNAFEQATSSFTEARDKELTPKLFEAMYDHVRDIYNLLQDQLN